MNGLIGSLAVAGIAFCCCKFALDILAAAQARWAKEKKEKKA